MTGTSGSLVRSVAAGRVSSAASLCGGASLGVSELGGGTGSIWGERPGPFTVDVRRRQGLDPVHVRPSGLGCDAGGHGHHPHDAVGGEEAFRQGEAPFVGLLVHSLIG